MMNAKRLFSMLALLLALVMLFSVLYIALEAEHDCCGECCVICARIQACEKLLGDLLPAAALLLAVRARRSAFLRTRRVLARIPTP